MRAKARVEARPSKKKEPQKKLTMEEMQAYMVEMEERVAEERRLGDAAPRRRALLKKHGPEEGRVKIKRDGSGTARLAFKYRSREQKEIDREMLTQDARGFTAKTRRKNRVRGGIMFSVCGLITITVIGLIFGRMFDVSIFGEGFFNVTIGADEPEDVEKDVINVLGRTTAVFIAMGLFVLFCGAGAIAVMFCAKDGKGMLALSACFVGLFTCPLVRDRRPRREPTDAELANENESEKRSRWARVINSMMLFVLAGLCAWPVGLIIVGSIAITAPLATVFVGLYLLTYRVLHIVNRRSTVSSKSGSAVSTLIAFTHIAPRVIQFVIEAAVRIVFGVIRVIQMAIAFSPILLPAVIYERLRVRLEGILLAPILMPILDFFTFEIFQTPLFVFDLVEEFDCLGMRAPLFCAVLVGVALLVVAAVRFGALQSLAALSRAVLWDRTEWYVPILSAIVAVLLQGITVYLQVSVQTGVRTIARQFEEDGLRSCGMPNDFVFVIIVMPIMYGIILTLFVANFVATITHKPIHSLWAKPDSAGISVFCPLRQASRSAIGVVDDNGALQSPVHFLPDATAVPDTEDGYKRYVDGAEDSFGRIYSFLLTYMGIWRPFTAGHVVQEMVTATWPRVRARFPALTRSSEFSFERDVDDPPVLRDHVRIANLRKDEELLLEICADKKDGEGGLEAVRQALRQCTIDTYAAADHMHEQYLAARALSVSLAFQLIPYFGYPFGQLIVALNSPILANLTDGLLLVDGKSMAGLVRRKALVVSNVIKYAATVALALPLSPGLSPMMFEIFVTILVGCLVFDAIVSTVKSESEFWNVRKHHRTADAREQDGKLDGMASSILAAAQEDEDECDSDERDSDERDSDEVQTTSPRTAASLDNAEPVAFPLDNEETHGDAPKVADVPSSAKDKYAPTMHPFGINEEEEDLILDVENA